MPDCQEFNDIPECNTLNYVCEFNNGFKCSKFRKMGLGNIKDFCRVRKLKHRLPHTELLLKNQKEKMLQQVAGNRRNNIRQVHLLHSARFSLQRKHLTNLLRKQTAALGSTTNCPAKRNCYY